MDVAIIGMAGRFPGARNIQEFWRNLRDGTEAIRSLERKDLEEAGVSAACLDDPSYVPVASMVDDIQMFDAAFFGYSPREASLLDPQSRLFLECAWEALESSGYNPQNTGKSVGVFASQSLSTYLLQNVHPQLTFDEFVLSGGNLNAILGNGSDFLPTRVSYKLNLRGPSINVQTACSSSLVAVHMARQGLLGGECEMALAGGVSIYLPQDTGYRFQEGMILSPDGHCRPFDAEARGTVFGRGVGVVVLKPLAAAVRDGDPIYAIIKGSAINNDGAAKVGYTAPGIDGQADVIAQAVANSGIDTDTISYIEAHGTGTPQGDPIEIAALTRAFRETTDKTQFCALGSVKGNIGHLDVAAGITGLIKTALMLKHRQRPPSLHFTRPNPQIDFANSPFYVNVAIDDWPSAHAPRRAGVSSFGMGGTNAHVILEESPEVERRAASMERPVHILALSAKTPEALRILAARQETYLGETAAPVADVCYTAAVGRAHWKRRVAVVGDSAEAIRDRLRALEQEPDAFKPSDIGNGAPQIAFLFTGQGVQYPGMARQLYDTHPTFRATLDRCSEIIGAELPRSLMEVLYPADPNDHAIDATNFTQPALFAVEYALAELWRSWGIVPAAVIGHSIGEYVAACVAGVFSLEDALHLVVERARLMHAAPGSGEMAAVFASEDVVAQAIVDVADRVALAAINGPAQVVVSGEPNAIATVLQRLDVAAIRWQRLAVSHAFHSPCMDPVLDEFERALERVHFREPQLAVISNVSGRAALTGDLTNPNYWRRHLRQPVRFADGIKSLLGMGHRWFVEIGPHPALTGAAKIVADDPQVKWLASLRRGTGDWSSMLQSLAVLYAGGAAVDWNAFDAPYARRRVVLPTYPFERQRHWIDVPKKADSKPVANDLPGWRLKSPAIAGAVFEAVVSTEQSYLNDHRLFGMAVFPATGYLAAALGAAEATSIDMPIAVEGLTLTQALIVPNGARRVVQSVLTPQAAGVSQFQFFSERPADGDDAGWILHASGTIRHLHSTAPAAVDVTALRERCNERVDVAAHYDGLHARGLQFGPAFWGLSELFRTTNEAIAHVILPEHLNAEVAGNVVHPAFLDAAQQTVIQAVGDCKDEPGVLVPVSIERLVLREKLPHSLWSHARVSPCGPNGYLAEIHLYDEAGRLVASIEGLRVQRVQAETLKRATQRDPAADWLYEVQWQPDGRTYSEAQPAASLLAAPSALAAQISTMFEPIGTAEGLPRYREMLASFDRLCAMYAERALVELGWRPAAGERFTAESLGLQLGVLPRYGRLLGRLLEILQQEGRMNISGDGFSAVGPLAVADYEGLRNDLLKRYPESESRVQIELVAACGEQLAQVLRGTVDPLQLLFPGGSVSNLEQLYGQSAFARVYNRLAGDTLAAACAKIPKGRRIRALEVGAGTGGTTRYVLPKLQQSDVEYVFSDVGNLFLHRARENFKQYPNVRFEILDVERDPMAQGFASNQFDIILASNVLHATSDLRRTLGHMKDLLAPDGLLVFVEGTGPARWVDLTFGLTEGWWKFTDSDLRPKHPLLSRHQWMSTLQELGFSEAGSFPNVERGEGDGWQIIGVARGPAMDAETLAQNIENRRDPWVIVGDRSGFASLLRQQFALRGEAALIIQRDDLKRGFAQAVTGGRSIRGIVHLAPLDAAISPSSAESSLEKASAIAAGSALVLVQTIAAVYPSDPPRLWIVTRGVHDVAGTLEASSLPQSLVWGLGRTLAFEHPELRNVRVDLDPQDPDAASKLCQEILAADDEDQIAIRGIERRVARLVRKDLRLDPDSVPESEEMRSLTIGKRGVLDNLQLARIARRSPGPSEVEIRVHATGLNFRDVLNALGMYPGPVPPFGGECAGTVVRVGENVRTMRQGDEVVALAYDSFATFAQAREEFVASKPASLSFEDAATLPVAFLTATYALKTKAGLTSGDRVLIHAAAGGVGYAAVQLAQRAGAEIFATAGSEEKRKWLRSVGVQHVFDSRTTAFADAILERTGGKGVDVVLNSLSGDFIAASLSATASSGRFIELGKSGIWTPEQVAASRPDVKYVVVDFAAESEKDPALVSSMLPAIVADAVGGRIRPLPVTTFALEDVAQAFRFMAQAKHTGKIVVTQQPVTQSDFRANASYLITGGTGGLGLAVAKWMTARGARHFVLMGRTGASADALAQIHEIEKLGASIKVAQGDVSKRADVQALVDQITCGQAPLRGIIHAAGTLDDGVLLQQSWKRFEHVLGAKMSGAWNLHVATAGVPLDFFVLFSSAASILGSAGQSNHAAANAFLDALAFTRRHSGLPALSINWGPWSEIGAAATVPAILERVRLQGMEGISPDEGLRVFGALLRSNEVQVGVLPVEWDRFVVPFGDHVSPYFSIVLGTQRRATELGEPVKAPKKETLVARALAAPAAERRPMLVAHIRDQVRRALGFDAQYVIDDRESLNNIGVDSLMAVELRNILGASLSMKRSLPATLLFDYPTIDTLADYLLGVLGLASKQPASPAKNEDHAALAAEIAQLSDAEAELRLLQELDAMPFNRKGGQ
jgi:acyl transferase domain-containing protein/NADPH:quinone reductase-like Zn-dependent oxidoreductase/SAM-dependent methyltransferase/acyl carrier protein